MSTEEKQLIKNATAEIKELDFKNLQLVNANIQVLRASQKAHEDEYAESNTKPVNV